MGNDYTYTDQDLATLLLRRWYPERTDRESGIIRDWLAARGREYDRFSFSVRVGQGTTPDPSHLPGVQQQVIDASRKRIDVLAWQGPQPFIIEVKERVTPGALGQVIAYAHLWQEEHPDSRPPRLQIIARYADQDTLRVLAAHGVDVLLYTAENGQ